MLVKCACCGKEFEAVRVTRQYCSDRCRTRACRERKDNKKDRQKREPKQTQRPAAFQRFDRHDIRTIEMVNAVRKHGKWSVEYLQSLQEYELSVDPNSNTTINGISVRDPYFVENAYDSIKESNKVILQRN